MTPSPNSSTAPLLPRLTRNEAQARNLLAQRAQHRPLDLAGQVWHVSLTPWLPGAPASAPSAGDWLVQAEWAGAPFDIHLPASAGAALVAARFPQTDLPPLSGAFAAAALETALEPLIDALQAMQRGPARLEQIRRQPTETRGLAHAFGLSLHHEAQAIHGALATDALGLMLLAGLVARLPVLGNSLESPAGDHLPLPLRVEIGRSLLAADLLATLTPGDALLLQECWTGQDGELRLLIGGFGLRARWNDSQLTVTQTLTPEGLFMPPSLDPIEPSSTGAAVAIPDLPVRLSFDLGERMLTLGELRALQVGQALDLGRPLTGIVNVRANGTLIGTGELIEIDSQVGVVIATLAAATRSPTP